MQRTIISMVVMAGVGAGPMAIAAEERIWVSRKGEHRTAQLLKVEGANAVLVTPEPKEVRVEIADLSLVDRHYLVEYGGADPKILNSSELGVPEANTRVDKGGFKRLDDKLPFGDNPRLAFDPLQSPHFLVAGDMQTTSVAEMAERLWHGMAFQHVNFLEDWGDKRMLILLVENDDSYAALGDWYKTELQKKKGEHIKEHARHVRVLWEQLGSTVMLVSEKMAKEYNLLPEALVFNVGEDTKSYGKVFGAFPTHSLASALITHQLGGVSEYAEDGYFAITAGHAYFKEIQLAQRTDTMLIDLGEYNDNELVKTEGFEDGTSWAKTLRRMVSKGKVKPSLKKLLKWNARTLTPEGLVLTYSFGYYLQSTPERMNAFANLVRRIEYSDAVPLPIEMAKLYGFKTVEEFEADWVEFIKSLDFK